MDPKHAHILSVRSSLQDTISVPLALNAMSHTVELCPSPGPAPKGEQSFSSELLVMLTAHRLTEQQLHCDCIEAAVLHIVVTNLM